ncbi:MAG: hypothetical protein HONBIEJF_00139 [Fimbriimonadaceae bacterium]|nr:hypothetical protein [Fimbriimonadaceae bacterium]
MVLADEISKASGRGIAVNREQGKGHFNFEVYKRKNEHESVLRGRLNFATRNEDARRRVEIHMPKADEFGVAEKVGEFSGKGRLRVWENGQLVANVPGRVSVRVVDRRSRKNQTGEPDIIRVVFNGEDRKFEFEGLVRDGDIIVEKKRK